MYRCLWLKNTNSREKQIYTRCKHFLNLGQKRNQAFYPLLLDRDVYYSNKREGVKYFCDNVQFIHSFKKFTHQSIYLLFSRLRKNFGCVEASTTRRLS